MDNQTYIVVDSGHQNFAAVLIALAGGAAATAAPANPKKEAAPAAPKPAPGGESRPASNASGHTVVSVRAAVKAIIDAAKASGDSSKKDQLPALLTKYGTDSVTNMDASHYSAFMEDLANL